MTILTERFGLRAPIVLAPMAGGPSTPALCAAVCEAGGLGSLGAQYLPLEKVRAEIREVLSRTRRPFAVNLFADDGASASPGEIEGASRALQKYRDELGLGPLKEPPKAIPLRESFAVLLEEKVPAFSFTFGIPPREILEACRREGTPLMGTATSLAEAVALDKAGVDYIFAQGMEAGGHRGTHDRDRAPPLIGTLALVREIARTCRTPVIAAGGIMDGAGIRAALALGACGASLGTAFLLCPEAGTSAPYRAALKKATDESIVSTRAFSGRWARGIANRFTREMADATIASYPAQNNLTRDLRAASAKSGSPEMLSLWAGQGVSLLREMPAADLVNALIDELR
jgi:nitronate monooxygenase